MLFLTYLLILSYWVEIGVGLQCSRIHKDDPKYHLIGNCLRSKSSVIAYGDQTDLKDCMRYAVDMRGLAFNFRTPVSTTTSKSPNSAKSEKLVTYDLVNYEDEIQTSCEVLDCPENENLTTLEGSSDFDYYSFYADPIPILNFTCISSIGLFRIHSKRLNFTEAMEACQLEFGDLAHILSEARTNGLANLIKQLYKGSNIARQQFYVGLWDPNGNGSWRTVVDEPLDCFPFRAWAPGCPKLPKRKKFCVTVNSSKMWSVVNCNKRLPYICELYPNGPLGPNANITLSDSVGDVECMK